MAPCVGRIRPRDKYIKGTDNNSTDTMSRLHLIKSGVKENEITWGGLPERYCVKKIDSDTFPSTYQTIDEYQR